MYVYMWMFVVAHTQETCLNEKRRAANSLGGNAADLPLLHKAMIAPFKDTGTPMLCYAVPNSWHHFSILAKIGSITCQFGSDLKYWETMAQTGQIHLRFSQFLRKEGHLLLISKRLNPVMREEVMFIIPEDTSSSKLWI